jgi:hypothetical protein
MRLYLITIACIISARVFSAEWDFEKIPNGDISASEVSTNLSKYYGLKVQWPLAGDTKLAVKGAGKSEATSAAQILTDIVISEGLTLANGDSAFIEFKKIKESNIGLFGVVGPLVSSISYNTKNHTIECKLASPKEVLKIITACEIKLNDGTVIKLRKASAFSYVSKENEITEALWSQGAAKGATLAVSENGYGMMEIISTKVMGDINGLAGSGVAAVRGQLADVRIQSIGRTDDPVGGLPKISGEKICKSLQCFFEPVDRPISLLSISISSKRISGLTRFVLFKPKELYIEYLIDEKESADGLFVSQVFAKIADEKNNETLAINMCAVAPTGR